MTIEHNQTQVSTEDLAIELAELRLKVAEGYLSAERKESIHRRIAYLSFELSERAKE